MSIRDFKREQNNNSFNESSCGTNNFTEDDYSKIKESNPEDVKKIENIAKKYQGRSEQDIMSEIFKLAQQEKAKGNLSNSKINRFANALMPMLNAEQREKLESLLGKIKE